MRYSEDIVVICDQDKSEAGIIDHGLGREGGQPMYIVYQTYMAQLMALLGTTGGPDSGNRPSRRVGVCLAHSQCKNTHIDLN